MALFTKAYSRYRMAVRQADGFMEECDVPPVTITSIRDSRGQDWEASITYGYDISLYKNWCGEEFPIVFEKKREYISHPPPFFFFAILLPLPYVQKQIKKMGVTRNRLCPAPILFLPLWSWLGTHPP